MLPTLWWPRCRERVGNIRRAGGVLYSSSPHASPSASATPGSPLALLCDAGVPAATAATAATAPSAGAQSSSVGASAAAASACSSAELAPLRAPLCVSHRCAGGGGACGMDDGGSDAGGTCGGATGWSLRASARAADGEPGDGSGSGMGCCVSCAGCAERTTSVEEASCSAGCCCDAMGECTCTHVKPGKTPARRPLTNTRNDGGQQANNATHETLANSSRDETNNLRM